MPIDWSREVILTASEDLSNHSTSILATLGGALLAIRIFFLKMSKDTITLKADKAERSAYDTFTKRINELDSRIRVLEKERHKLLSFATTATAFLAQLPLTDKELARERKKVLDQYQTLLADDADVIQDTFNIKDGD